MLGAIADGGFRARLFLTRVLRFVGFGEGTFLLLMAVVIGVVTSAAAVSFHELILLIRDLLYKSIRPEFLYGRGIWLLIAWPALGGLAVGVLSKYVLRAREGHGVIDVMESVVRSSGFVKPATAFEKIITSAITIGSGGSTGAEGPIVQIGAALAAGVGSLFRISRTLMPVLIGCGSAAGISAIFNSPIGGVLFALEVILQDFSIKAFAPVVIASVVANVTTQAIFRNILQEPGLSIFRVDGVPIVVTWPQMGNFVLLGLMCGVVGVSLNRLLYRSELWFRKVPVPRAVRPAVGGAMLGVLGILFVTLFGWSRLGVGHKPFSSSVYPEPAFFGDGYGFIQEVISPAFYNTSHTVAYLLALFGFLIVAKVVGTCMTISSGGSGGVIAVALFLGAVTGGLVGVALRSTGLFADVQPNVYALIGMGAVLAAVVHSPMAALLILLELTRNNDLILPAMLAVVVATGTARRIHPESVYTLALRQRGIRFGNQADLLLARLYVEQVDLEPAAVVQPNDPLERLLDLIGRMNVSNFAVIDKTGQYVGMVVAHDINTALLAREAVPLLTVAEMMRTDIPLVKNTDDLATVLTRFGESEITHLPVELANSPGKVIGMISRAGVMRKYRAE